MGLLLRLGGLAGAVLLSVVAYLNVAGTDVVVLNAGASPIRLRGQLPAGLESAIATAGVKLPDELRPGTPAVVRVPRVSGEVTATSGSITVSLWGQSMTFDASCQSLDLDGATLLGRQTRVSLGERPRHDLKLACG